jgi:hypothetical protein
MDRREERILENEQAFAAINQRLRHDLERTGESDTDLVAFVCECGQAACHDSVEVTLAEYRDTHADPRDFVVIPGHEIPDVEDVADRTERFVRIRKHAV